MSKQTKSEEFRKYLDERKIEYKHIHHNPTITGLDANEELSDLKDIVGIKSIIVKIDNGKNILIAVPNDRKFSNSKVRKLLNIKDIRVVNIEEMEKITNGIKRGGIYPFGNLFSIRTYADKSIEEFDKVYFNCGSPSESIVVQNKRLYFFS